MSSLARWNRLYINTKIYYLTHWTSHPIGIFFPYKHPGRKKYITLNISFAQTTNFQCCHNHLKSTCFWERASTRSGANVYYQLDSCKVMMWLRCHMIMLGGVFSFYSTTIESRNITFSACHVTTWLNFPVTLLVWSLCLESPPC